MLPAGVSRHKHWPHQAKTATYATHLGLLLGFPLCLFCSPLVLIRADLVGLGLPSSLLFPPLALPLPLPALPGVLRRLITVLWGSRSVDTGVAMCVDTGIACVDTGVACV